MQKADSGKSGEDKPPCTFQKELAGMFDKHNTDLFELLDNNPGPVQEQRPFKKFGFHCEGRDESRFLTLQKNFG
jgi:hypothetical protein